MNFSNDHGFLCHSVPVPVRTSCSQILIQIHFYILIEGVLWCRGNSMDCHRLLTYAAKQGYEKQHALAGELFINYHVEGKYIGDKYVVVLKIYIKSLTHLPLVMLFPLWILGKFYWMLPKKLELKEQKSCSMIPIKELMRYIRVYSGLFKLLRFGINWQYWQSLYKHLNWNQTFEF